MAVIKIDNDYVQVPDDATPDELDSIAQHHAGIVQPEQSLASKASGMVGDLGKATAETILPPTSADAAKRMLSPRAGQYGVSGLAQMAGETVKNAVSSVSPTAGKVLPPLTPRSEQEQIGAEAALTPVGEAIAPLGKAIGKTLEATSGLRYKAPGVLADIAENPSRLLSSGKEGAQPAYAAARKGIEDQTSRFEGLIKNGEIIDKVRDALHGGETLTTKEAHQARKAIDAVIRNGSDTTYSREGLQGIRDQLDAVVKKDPAMAEADRQYASGSRASAARSLFPLTKKGDIAHMRTALGVASTLLGHSHPAALGADLLFSPLAQSLVAAGTGAARNLAPAAAAAATENLDNNTTQPTPEDNKIVTTLAKILAQRKSNGK